MFKTQCPYCKVKGELFVVFFKDALGRSRYPSALLSSDGFETGLGERFVDKHGADTSDERVQCDNCEKEFPITEVLK
jgi:hypothetical protein